MKSISIPLPHFDDRPEGIKIDTIVVHSMYLPGANKPFQCENCVEALNLNKVAAHYVIDREGRNYSLVPEEKRAWHAGVSKMPHDQRENVNHFSIGIELIGDDLVPFTDQQYQSLALLTKDIISRQPIAFIVGHNHIAPGRKSDPGPNFDWNRYRNLVDLGDDSQIKFP